MREARVVVMSPAGTRLRVLRAERFIDRLRGLLGRESLTGRYGLWISPCSAVHTFGMRGPVDLVFVDRQGRILRVDSGVRPWRMRRCGGSHGVLEMAAGSAARLGLDRPAVRLAWQETPQ